jgi:hypothetical protein
MKQMQRLCIFGIQFKIRSVFITTFLTQWNLQTCGKRLHDHIISLLRKVWIYKSSVTPQRFIETHLPSQVSEQCVRGINKHIYQAMKVGSVCYRYRYLHLPSQESEQCVLEVSINTSTKPGKWAVCARGIDTYIYQARKVSSVC